MFKFRFFNSGISILIPLLTVAIALNSCRQNSVNNSNSTNNNQTNTTLEKIKNKNKIMIGVKTDYRPFGFIDQTGNNAGLEIDIAHYLTKELLGDETKVEFVPVVASNRIEFLQQGKVDLVIATMTDTPDRRKVIDFSENYYSAGTGFLTKKDNKIKSWDDLKGKKVCGVQGSFYNKDLTQMGIEMVNFPGTAEAYKALQEGRCLGFAYDDSAFAGKLLEPEWSQQWHQALPPILSQPWGMGIKKGDQEFLDKINQAIIKMEAEGLIVNGEIKWKIPPTEYAKTRMNQAQSQLKNQN